jgi:hypothetical protein
MRVILVLLIAFFVTVSSAARADNPYAAAGISDLAQVTQFLARLKRAMAADDRAAITAMVKYPLTVHPATGRPAIYRNAAGAERQLRSGLHARSQGRYRRRQARQSFRARSGRHDRQRGNLDE